MTLAVQDIEAKLTIFESADDGGNLEQVRRTNNNNTNNVGHPLEIN
jgi:hypothetical protein